MKNFLTVFVLLATMFSCEKYEPKNVGPLDGTYTGVFFRANPQANYQTADVTIVFDGNTFEGSSSIVKYPAICRGTYTLTGDEIEFTNLCVWTAEFDWTYILNGKFKITKEGNQLRMTRNYDNATQHTYQLIQ